GRPRAEHCSTIFPGGSGGDHREHDVAGEFKGAERKTVDGRAARDKRVTHTVAKVDGKGIDSAVDRTVVIGPHLRRRRNRSQRQTENCERSDMCFHGPHPPLSPICEEVQNSLRRNTPARPMIPEPNSMTLLGSGVLPPPPLMVNASEGIVPTALS